MRINKSFVFVLTAIMALALTACSSSSGDDDGKIDGGGIMLIDAGMADANSTPDAQTFPPATNLGQLCGVQPQPMCPAGYICTAITGQANANQRFCSVPCTPPGMVGNCSTGFPGPGVGACLLSSPGGGYACAIACGQQVQGGSTACPTGLTCQDFNGPQGTKDGMPDTCAP
jgi:hypothetical protein